MRIILLYIYELIPVPAVPENLFEQVLVLPALQNEAPVDRQAPNTKLHAQGLQSPEQGQAQEQK